MRFIIKIIMLAAFAFLMHYIGSLFGFWEYSLNFLLFAFIASFLFVIYEVIKLYRRNSLFSKLIGINQERSKAFFEKYNEHLVFSDDSSFLNGLLEGNMYLFIENGETVYFKFTSNNHSEKFYINTFIKLVR